MRCQCSTTTGARQAFRQPPAPVGGAGAARRPARQLSQQPRCSSASASASSHHEHSSSGSSSSVTSSSGSSSAPPAYSRTVAAADSSISSIGGGSGGGGSGVTVSSSYALAAAAAAAAVAALATATAAGSSCRVRPAENSDYWAVADLHCSAFYPRATPFGFAALRLDRVMALQMGRERQDMGHFACLVAEYASSGSSDSISDGGSSSEVASSAGYGQGGATASSGSSSSLPSTAAAPTSPAAAAAAAAAYGSTPAARAYAAAATGRVELGPLVDTVVSLCFPPNMRLNYAASYTAGGLRGVVVIDTVGAHVPPKRTRMPNGTVREVPRPGIAYLSNLAVAPCTRRAGVGRKLMLEAEEVAASWGCRSMALHVDPTNTAAVQLYKRAGYRVVLHQPEWQRMLEGRQHPLALMMRVLPWQQRQRYKQQQQAWQQQQ